MGCIHAIENDRLLIDEAAESHLQPFVLFGKVLINVKENNYSSAWTALQQLLTYSAGDVDSDGDNNNDVNSCCSFELALAAVKSFSDGYKYQYRPNVITANDNSTISSSDGIDLNTEDYRSSREDGNQKNLADEAFWLLTKLFHR